MPATDGSLIFNTKIDTSGMEKDAKGVSSKVVDLRNKVSSTAAAVKNLREELEKTGGTKVKTKVAEGLEREIAKAQEKLNMLDAQADRMIDKKRADFGVDKNDDATLEYLLSQDKEWQKLQAQITAAEDKLDSYKRQLRQVEAAAPLAKDTAEYQKKEQRLSELTGQLEVYKAKLSEAEQKEQQTAAQTGNASNKAKEYRRYLNSTIKALKMFASGLGKVHNTLKKTFSNTVGKGIQNIGKHFGSANSKANVFEKSLRRIKNTLVRMFFFRLVHSPIDAVKDGLGEISKISPTVNKNLSDLKTSSNYLKNSFASLAAPLLNLVTPAFVNFMNITAEVTDKVARLIALLSGQDSYTKAVRVQQDYAASLDDTTDSVKNNTKAVKENQKNLAKFDELNVMSDDSSDDDSTSSQSEQPMFENVTAQVDGIEKTLLDALKRQDWNAVGTLIGDKVNSALNRFDWTKIKRTARKWAVNIADLFNGFLKETDWNKVGETAAEGVNTAISFMLGFSYTFDWKLLGRSIRRTLIGFFENLDVEGAKAAFVQTINGLISAGLELLGNPKDFSVWGKRFGENLADVIRNISWNDLGDLFFGFLSGIFNFGDGMVSSIDWTDFGKSVKTSFENFFGEDGSGYQFLVDMSTFFKDLFIGLLTSIDAVFDGTDWKAEGKKIAEGFKELDFEKLLGKDSLLGKILNVLSKMLIAGLDFCIGFFEEPGTADKLANGFETLMSNVPWEEIIIKTLTLALFDIPAWITEFATNLIKDFCEGLATGFRYYENDEKLNSAALDFVKSIGNLIISVIESVVNIVINAVPNLILGALKLVWDLMSRLFSLVLGEDFYKTATQDLWGPDSFHFDFDFHIPRLATGTVVPANFGEFTAILGDNKREPEIVSPLSSMKQAFLEALAESGYSGGSGGYINNTIVLPDGSVLLRVVGEADDEYSKSHGQSRFERRQPT